MKAKNVLLYASNFPEIFNIINIHILNSELNWKNNAIWSVCLGVFLTKFIIAREIQIFSYIVRQCQKNRVVYGCKLNFLSPFCEKFTKSCSTSCRKAPRCAESEKAFQCRTSKWIFNNVGGFVYVFLTQYLGQFNHHVLSTQLEKILRKSFQT